ncbi:MAG: serine O-acetyltransferase [Cyanophyceae cyanobacterium]
MFEILKADFRIIFERDPAARNWLEVLLCYPGLQALVLHRFAHALHRWHLPVIPRVISHLSRFLTGIEIHPGATVGKGVCIDHGMGVVIGETAIVGDYCLIYQGVTLGGTGKESGKRHPTLGENVVVGAGAKVLGNLQIGSNVRIGAGSVVLRDVPPDCTVVGVPGRVVYRSGAKVEPLAHGRLPDSEAQVIRLLLDRIESLEKQVEELQNRPHPQPAFVSAINSLEGDGEMPDWDRLARMLAQPEAIASGGQGDRSAAAAQSCRIRDRAIEEYFDGMGI